VPPPRALSPAGVVLVDKEQGPSSFAVVRRLRNRTGARAGHAGTLDPFASGLLLVFLGAATKVVGRFVGLDKRYLADVDLGAVSTTGDPEGELTPCDVPDADELERRLDGLRGEVELPVPAYSAVKIGGQRAYKLARGGAAVEMPVRRSVVRTLDLVAFDGRVARLDLLVSSGTYVRSIAAALGGHCAALRRTEVGPFGVDEADEERIVPAAEALARLA
jgi:tRNA pseudouridine55 synthase